MEPSPEIAAHQHGDRVRVRVRCRRHRSYLYNQFGFGRKDLVVGLIILLLLTAAAGWFSYAIFTTNSNPAQSAPLPEGEKGAARF